MSPTHALGRHRPPITSPSARGSAGPWRHQRAAGRPADTREICGAPCIFRVLERSPPPKWRSSQHVSGPAGVDLSKWRTEVGCEAPEGGPGGQTRNTRRRGGNRQAATKRLRGLRDAMRRHARSTPSVVLGDADTGPPARTAGGSPRDSGGSPRQAPRDGRTPRGGPTERVLQAGPGALGRGLPVTGV